MYQSPGHLACHGGTSHGGSSSPFSSNQKPGCLKAPFLLLRKPGILLDCRLLLPLPLPAGPATYSSLFRLLLPHLFFSSSFHASDLPVLPLCPHILPVPLTEGTSVIRGWPEWPLAQGWLHADPLCIAPEKTASPNCCAFVFMSILKMEKRVLDR